MPRAAQRRVLVLTDGQVSNEAEVPGERIEPKVLRTFARLRTKLWDDVRVDYKGLTVEQAPRRLPPIFADEVLTVFARIEAGASDHVELALGEQRFRIALLAREAPERESEWRAAVDKAKAYCAQKPSAFDAASLL